MISVPDNAVPLGEYARLTWAVCRLRIDPYPSNATQPDTLPRSQGVKLLAVSSLFRSLCAHALTMSVDLYSAFATICIANVTILYLRLYFLPKDQARPPYNPPQAILDNETIYECLSAAEAQAVALARRTSQSPLVSDEPTPLHGLQAGLLPPALVNRCYREGCNGRWKPARTRHCSLCGTCRAGFDHHCAIFANCVTAPHIPTFLSLLLCTPPTVLTLIAPLLVTLLRRCGAAWRIAGSSEVIRQRWWDWKPSWIIAGGPMGRWVGGLVMGWKMLDREDAGGLYGNVRLKIGVLVFLGVAFSALCLVSPHTAQSCRPSSGLRTET
jgi:hypothetical protein